MKKHSPPWQFRKRPWELLNLRQQKKERKKAGL